jgi:hypothetical protein
MFVLAMEVRLQSIQEILDFYNRQMGEFERILTRTEEIKTEYYKCKINEPSTLDGIKVLSECVYKNNGQLDKLIGEYRRLRILMEKIYDSERTLRRAAANPTVFIF